ncbi:chromodomain helicase DNA binding protein [Trifolium pratense]|uniref:Chromodomain helicase DNA binding protein n=1 Tax=Trifolium pratense TaxID=57577 RepID=A0A2K3LE45_TRIPR|nr:chromodomain helicase DNA binding protein [Trifolium pratense]
MQVLFQTDMKDKKPKQRGSRTGKKAKQSFKSKSRDNDLHKLLFMPNGLPDGAELAYYVKGHAS